jgi:hypothetical protein
MVLGGRAFERKTRSEGWSPHDGISALITRDRREHSSFSLCHVMIQESNYLQTTKQRHDVRTLILDFPASKIKRNKISVV